MAYTPDNPYIPGDPYSYDLKWIVDKLKEAISLYQPLNDKFDNLYDYVHDYFDNLDLTEEVQNIIDQMETDGFFDALVTQIVTDSGTIESTVTNWLNANVDPVGSAVVVDDSLTISGAAADAKTAGSYVRSIAGYNGVFTDYLKYADSYIDLSGTPVSNSSYDVYEIPVDVLDIIKIEYTPGIKPWGTLSNQAAVQFHTVNNTFINASGLNPYFCVDATNSHMIAIAADADIDFFYLTIAKSSISTTQVFINCERPYAQFEKKDNNYILQAAVISTENSISSNVYYEPVSGNLRTSNTADTILIKAAKGQKISIENRAFTTPITLYGLSNPRAEKELNAVADENSVVSIFTNGSIGTVSLIPSGIIFTPFVNKKIVAFGTSLTYRSETTGGYLNYLPALLGVPILNKGIGSAVIMPNGTQPNLLASILAFDFSTYDIVLLEGFTNDWYYNGADLGSITDTTSTTVCGAIYTAIDHILSDNPASKIYAVLDHCGTGISAVDAVNSAGDTQPVFYDQCSAVFERYGIKTIKLYETAGINTLNAATMLIDNIHPTAAGAKATAAAIYEGIL